MTHDILLSEFESQYALASCTISYNDENFFLTMHSGRSSKVYVLTPKHAKRILMLMQRDMDEFEEKYGQLETELPPNNRPDTSSLESRQMGFTVS